MSMNIMVVDDEQSIADLIEKYNSSEPNQEEHLIAFSGLVLNMDTHECTLNEKKLSLTPKKQPGKTKESCT